MAMKTLGALILLYLLSATAEAGPGTRICYFGNIRAKLPAAWAGQPANVTWYAIHYDGSRYFIASENTAGALSVQFLTHTYGLLEADSTLGSTGETATAQLEVAGPTSPRDCPGPAGAPPYSVALE